MNNEELVLSVVIPMYNSSNTIEQCIKSVIDELEINNINNYEILLIDDGSTDDTYKKCEKLLYNKRIKLIKQQNAGPSAARNKGIELAQGKFIAFNDSDDMWLKDKIYNQLQYLKENPDISLICSQYGYSKPKKTQVIKYRKEVFHNYYSTQTSIAKREVFKGNKFPVKQKYSEDMHFIIDLMKTHKCVYLGINSTASITNKREFGESGLSSHLWDMEKGELTNIIYIRKLKKINFLIFLFGILWSLLKFFRRVWLSKKI